MSAVCMMVAQVPFIPPGRHWRNGPSGTSAIGGMGAGREIGQKGSCLLTEFPNYATV